MSSQKVSYPAQNQPEIVSFRLDLKTRISLMAAFIYGSEPMDVQEAIDKAVEIENAADAQVRKMKADNWVPRRNVRK